MLVKEYSGSRKAGVGDAIGKGMWSGGRPIMMFDGAGWHRNESLIIPDNIRLLRLPPYSPELNPLNTLGMICGKSHFTSWSLIALMRLRIILKLHYETLKMIKITSIRLPLGRRLFMHFFNCGKLASNRLLPAFKIICRQQP